MKTMFDEFDSLAFGFDVTGFAEQEARLADDIGIISGKDLKAAKESMKTWAEIFGGVEED
jgi:hypothetical protein